MSEDVRIGLALSGGGFRAAAFHLGVLKRLEELGVLARIHRLSTVSGGSMTGALYALQCVRKGTGAPGSYPVDALINDVRRLVTQNFRGRALFGNPLRVAQTTASFITRYVSRVPLLSNALDYQLYDGASLADVPPWLLINATNLMTGKGWKFFHDRAGDYLIGATDKTQGVRLSDAVLASAAYPGLTDPFPFHTQWDDMQEDLLDDRWHRPQIESRWRRMHGQAQGRLTIPLGDGGLYDNEGLNGLRSSDVTHAIYASTAAPEATYEGIRGPSSLLRMVDVIHSRLGAITRQHAHEMTHGANPFLVRRRLLALANHLEASSDTKHQAIAEELRELSAVGWPPRGHQYYATVPVLLHRTTLGKNGFARYTPPLDIPREYQGLHPNLADSLARIRTDLDAYHPRIVDLLIAQAYFLTDAHMQLAMPDVMSEASPPEWEWAIQAIRTANTNFRETAEIIRLETPRKILGRQGRITG